jgi:hypothetical protein
VERHEFSFSRRDFTRVFNLIVPLNHRATVLEVAR